MCQAYEMQVVPSYFSSMGKDYTKSLSTRWLVQFLTEKGFLNPFLLFSKQTHENKQTHKQYSFELTTKSCPH